MVTAAVTSAVINDKLMAIGEGSAARSVTVTSAAGGTLTALKVTPGDSGSRPAPSIAELDADSEQIAYDRARLASEDAAAALARSTELANSNSISSVQLNAAQLAADNAELELRNAQLALQSRSIVDPDRRHRRPAPGHARQPRQRPDASSRPSRTPPTSSSTSGCPSATPPSIAVGMPVTAVAVALPGQTFAGDVSAVDNRIDPASRTLQVAGADPQRRRPHPRRHVVPDHHELSRARPSPSVDPLSIQWSADGAYVWKYVDGKVEQAFVQIVERNSGGVLVTGDVADGDQVVTQGVLQLQRRRRGAAARRGRRADAAASATASRGRAADRQQQGTPL